MSSTHQKRVLMTVSLLVILTLIFTVGALASTTVERSAVASNRVLQPTVPTVPTIPPNACVLNEVAGLRSTTPDDEFIELTNPGTETCDLSGWRLFVSDGPGAAVYVIPGGTSIAAGGFLAIFAGTSGLYLADTGVNVQLLTPDGILVDQLITSAFTIDQSYSRKPDGTGPWFVFCSVTPGLSNLAATCGVPTAVELADLQAGSADSVSLLWPLAALAGFAVLVLAALGWRRSQRTV